MSEDPTSPAAVRDDRDLYCLQCGYNLRGLSGDPRRCPECGRLNFIAELEVQDEPVRAEVRKMEGTLAACVFALMGVVGFAILAVHFWMSQFSYDNMRPISCGLGVVGLAIVWFLAVRRFRTRCGDESAWRCVLWKYHWRLALFISAIVGLLPASVFLSRVLPVNLMAFTLLLLWVGVLLGGMEWVTRRARKDLQPLALNAWLRKQEQCRQSETFAGGE